MLLALGTILASACQTAKPNTASPTLRILTTNTILADLARNVVGDRATVDSLLSPGVDPHTYQPSPADVVRVSESTLLIVNGAGYEHTLQPIIDNAEGKRQIITASSGLEPGPGIPPVNPHFWVNPQFAVKYVENIRDGLIQADPINADAYTANAKAYIAQLNDLDSRAEKQISALPPERRLLVTNHDSLGYFAERYGFKVVGLIIPSSSDEAGASAEKLAAIIDAVRAAGAPAIFLDRVENQTLANQVSAESGAQVVNDLYFESLSGAGGPALTYIEMIRYDVNRIVEALKP